jgi:large conductance mechanosensitive channel
MGEFMSFLKEFREFAVKGNVVDMAVGIIIGAAFSGVVSSLVDNILMPMIGMLVGGVDFSGLAIVLRPAVGAEPALVLGYGQFLQHIVDFLIVAFAIFLLIKGINSLRRQEAAEPAVPPAPTREEALLTEIRDLLQTRGGA